MSTTEASGTGRSVSAAAQATSRLQPGNEVGIEVGFRYSPSFPGILEDLHCSLLLSTYPAGQLVAVGVADGQLAFSFRRFDQAMGIAVARDRVAVAGRDQIWLLPEHSELAAAIEPDGRHDRCWLARTSRPRFVSELAAQDRCHLNGLAMRDGKPAFVTVMAPTDSPAGWRKAANAHGAVLEVVSSDAVTTGLAMPHSPRWHAGTLFVLHSGFGRLETVDSATGHRDEVGLVPGYARGLAFHEQFAFVGLSQIRETAIFGDVPIAAYHNHLKCGVGVIDINTGTTVATLEFTTGVEEIFDIQIASGARCPTFGSPSGHASEVWLLPGRPPPSPASPS